MTDKQRSGKLIPKSKDEFGRPTVDLLNKKGDFETVNVNKIER